MKNCIVAQSGGATSVINASVVGVIKANNELKHYNNVYGGINGIEGILQGKTINLSKLTDNDLLYTDHTPGYGSAAKYIAIITLETYLDSRIYSNNGVFILEVMGRDTGWLAASAALARMKGKPVTAFIYLPELVFSEDKFLDELSDRFQKNNRAYVVVSEGVRDKLGKSLFTRCSDVKRHDDFYHEQLGGVGKYIEQIIKDNKIASKTRVLELNTAQRAAMHIASRTDMEEAYLMGKKAVKYSTHGCTGFMVGIKRLGNNPYKIETYKVEASKVANNTKYFPKEWIISEGNHITANAIEYITPLIMGELSLIMEEGIPKYLDPLAEHSYI